MFLLCGWLLVVHLSVIHGQRQEALLHIPRAVLLLGYPEDDTLYISRGEEDVMLQPPGPDRAGHHTYPSLSRNGAIVATSYVKSRHPNYREGIALYSFVDKAWKQYSGDDFHYVWAVSVSPDGSTLAFKAERHWSQPRQLLLLDLRTEATTVLMEPYLASAPLSWSPDGNRFVYEHPVKRANGTFDAGELEIRIHDVRTRQDVRLVSGSNPSWSPSGEWIAFLDSAGGVAMVRPDGKAQTPLVTLRRRLPWFVKRHLVYPPVWSPGSDALMLNEWSADETARASIHRFDLGTRTLKQARGTGVAVLGWAAQ